MSVSDWRVMALEEARAPLERAARQRSVITYSELAAQIHAAPLEPNSEALAGILDQISRESDEARGCMLSAVVIHRVGNGLPGSGFFKLAGGLGRDTSDELALHMSELAAVHRAFGSPH